MVAKNEIDISVILPSYQEEENLRILLPAIKSVLNSISSNYEILVIDTEQPMDNTEKVCKENLAVYYNRIGDNSYGSAIRTGIKNASGKKIIFMDSDGSHDPEFIKKLYSCKDEADIVIASRYVKGGMSENSKTLLFMSWVLNAIYSIVLNLKIKDMSNSFKLYDSAQIKELSLECNNFDIVEEIIYKLSLLNNDLKIKEIPFEFKKRLYGKTKRNMRVFIFTYIVTIIRLKRMKVKNRHL